MWQLETELFASSHVSQQKIKFQPTSTREIGGVTLSDVLYDHKRSEEI